ncbi:hypothetical protein [Moorena sp. SIO4G3]|uniref:hypothetical protein n=1 Tax=Moorena sp. SIO4G3 TaxID=2607821 RepID=UPI00142B3CB9|nr:hypothetical protein [Moorena sp. SIO4G3]NEO82140.1 hypothetical protein [Moorena sp. SIO4G3]
MTRIWLGFINKFSTKYLDINSVNCVKKFKVYQPLSVPSSLFPTPYSLLLYYQPLFTIAFYYFSVKFI